MRIEKILSVVALLLLGMCITPSFVFAGGGPVSLMAFPLRPFDETKAYILQVDVTTDQPCSEITPEVRFQNGVSGDSITPFAPPDDGTYFTRHYNTGQPKFQWKELCTTYFKAISGSQEQRTAIVTVKVEGITEERTTPVSYGTDAISKELQSFGRVNDYDNTPQVDVISEKPYYTYKREFSLQWQKISWAKQYTVFAQQINEDGTVTPPGAFETTEDTKAKLILPNEAAFYISVMACRENEDCNMARGDLYTYYVDKARTGAARMETNEKAVVTPVTTSKTEEKNIADLNKKVAELEGKLEESNKKQNVLEQRITDLVNFIKSLFPNFN